jgi:hypothetical protein
MPRLPDRISVRRSSEDPPLPEATAYMDWDAGNERERATRWGRTERVTAPDGRVGEAVEWEETIIYRAGKGRELPAATAYQASGFGKWLRAVVVVVGGFTMVSLLYTYAGVPLILCWAAYLVACWRFL